MSKEDTPRDDKKTGTRDTDPTQCDFHGCDRKIQTGIWKVKKVKEECRYCPIINHKDMQACMDWFPLLANQD